MAVLDGQRVKRRFREVEIELVGAGDAGGPRAHRRSLARGGRRGERGHPEGVPGARPRPLRRDRARGLRRTRRSPACWRRWGATSRPSTRTIPGRGSAPDAEELHQMRVSVRRLRAIPPGRSGSMFAPQADQGAPGRAEVAGLHARRSPGPRRAEGASPRGAAGSSSPRTGMPAGHAPQAARQGGREALPGGSGGPRQPALLRPPRQRGRDTISNPPVVDADVSLTDVAAGEWRKLRKTVKALPSEPADAELHAVRIKASTPATRGAGGVGAGPRRRALRRPREEAPGHSRRAPGRGGGRDAGSASWRGDAPARGPASLRVSSWSASTRVGRPRARRSRKCGRRSSGGDARRGDDSVGQEGTSMLRTLAQNWWALVLRGCARCCSA